MLLETHIQELAKVIGLVCHAHCNWETVPLHPRCALLLKAEVRSLLSPFIHCACSDHMEA